MTPTTLRQARRRTIKHRDYASVSSMDHTRSAMENKFLFLYIFPLVTVVISALFIWQGNKGFSLWDEGFLWYGVQRVMLGEVPIRDFMAYDPGRYYWSALLMNLWGNNGIIALRGAIAIFQMIGLFVALLLIMRSERYYNLFYLLLSTVTLLVWMFPRHKLFDISLCIFLLGALTFLVENPTCLRYFFTGVCVGLVAVFGRNHGIYGLAGSLGVMVWLNVKRMEGPRFIKGFSFWSAGVILGYTPILFMMLFVPGFAGAFWDSIRFLFEIKTTNLSLPVPWPWQANSIRGMLIGLFFCATVIFGVLSIAWIFWQKFKKNKITPALVAASFLALPYAHYAYSRADINHLAQGVFPLLVGCLVVLATQRAKVKWPLAIMLCIASSWVTLVCNPGLRCHASQQWVTIEISGNKILVDPRTASNVKLLHKLADQYAPDGQNFIVTPFWPGAYALLERKSPMWEIYALFPRSQAFEQNEIERIKAAKPAFVVVLNLPLDGRNDLRFKNTHPLIYQYIEDHFERLYTPNTVYQIYRVNGD